MNTQPRSGLTSTAPIRVSRNAMNPFGAKDLTALAATMSPAVPSARAALIATAAYRQTEFGEDFVEYVSAAPLATDVSDAVIAGEHYHSAASAVDAAGLRSGMAARGNPRA